MHSDFLKRPLAVGDAVVTTVSRYNELRLLYVHSFTAKKVRLHRKGEERVSYCMFPYQIVKLEALCTETE